MGEDEDDISADLARAFEGAEASEPPPEPAMQADPAPDMSEAPPEPTEPPTDGRARDEQGRFKPTGDKPVEQVQALDPTAQTPPEAPPGDTVPRSLSPEAKAQFATWPDMAKAEFIRREADTARGVEKLQQELRATSERYQPLEAVLAPHREKWQLQGMGEAQALQTLFAAQDMLERDAPRAIDYLARAYGVNLGQLSASPGTPAQQADPQVVALHQQVQTLTQRLQAQDLAALESQREKVAGEIEAFGQDPANIYFDNVKQQMGALIGSGAAKTLKQAYQMATWSNEQIRPLMLAAQRQEQEQIEATRRQGQAAAARAAGGSIAGSAGPGTAATVIVDPESSLEDDVRRAFDRSGGRV